MSLAAFLQASCGEQTGAGSDMGSSTLPIDQSADHINREGSKDGKAELGTMVKKHSATANESHAWWVMDIKRTTLDNCSTQ